MVSAVKADKTIWYANRWPWHYWYIIGYCYLQYQRAPHNQPLSPPSILCHLSTTNADIHKEMPARLIGNKTPSKTIAGMFFFICWHALVSCSKAVVTPYNGAHSMTITPYKIIPLDAAISTWSFFHPLEAFFQTTLSIRHVVYEENQQNRDLLCLKPRRVKECY